MEIPPDIRVIMMMIAVLWHLQLNVKLSWPLSLVQNDQKLYYYITRTYIEKDIGLQYNSMEYFPSNENTLKWAFKFIMCICAFTLYILSRPSKKIFGDLYGDEQIIFPKLTKKVNEYFYIQMRPIIAFPFTLNQMASEISAGQSTQENLMRYEWKRYQSFETFPSSSVMTPMRLAQAGFYYTGNVEEVKCFCCGITNKDWTTGETAMVVHRRLSARCNFIRGEINNNIRIHSNDYYSNVYDVPTPNQSTEEGSTEPLRPTTTGNSSPQQHNDRYISLQQNNRSVVRQRCSRETGTEANDTNVNVKHPEYRDLPKRISSFNSTWPYSSLHEPEKFARAGFYYTGESDRVCCFSCGWFFYKWMPNDDPWIEHAHYSPQCQFLLANKGNGVLPEACLPRPASLHNTSHQPTRDELLLKDLKKKLKKYKDKAQQLRCKVCLAKNVTHVILPCYHLTCEDCAEQLQNCAFCRNAKTSAKRVYMP